MTCCLSVECVGLPRWLGTGWPCFLPLSAFRLPGSGSGSGGGVCMPRYGMKAVIMGIEQWRPVRLFALLVASISIL
jgi:hypothetical protein